ncbi:AbiJ-NTD4 domain-containing protein [Bacteroides sp.]|uniref:AbiJ-NTD4 domain-containing protein n=1 Tax=Bacteroides sp. TaxID=29523 RepID=UPI00261B5B15|nr:hypothetical protein [Bacteroides sp.]MDD3038612.1 hypothetical protein [Bacteroides sp.]
MALFSERYRYTNPSDVIIREKITPEIQNAICSCYDLLYEKIEQSYKYDKLYWKMEEYLWTHFLNERKINFNYKFVATKYIDDVINKWFSKLDLIELSIKYLYAYSESNCLSDAIDDTHTFVQNLNREFKRLNFAYRIIDKKVVEITTEEEIVAIEKALSSSADNIRAHLNNALKLYAQKPIGDYRNSIKESITAVEAMSRRITGDKVLNFAKMEKKGVTIPSVLRQAFEKLYGYTNDEKTGIRHALMDDEGSYVPKAEEALFMLVSCSAFINYLNKKVK